MIKDLLKRIYYPQRVQIKNLEMMKIGSDYGIFLASKQYT